MAVGQERVVQGLYSEHEAIPVPVDDLGALARSAPTGPVGTQLSWGKVSGDDFERLSSSSFATHEARRTRTGS